jgi:hypothetical protein
LILPSPSRLDFDFTNPLAIATLVSFDPPDRSSIAGESWGERAPVNAYSFAPYVNGDEILDSPELKTG